MLAAGACAAKKPSILLWAGVKLRQFRTIVLGENKIEREVFCDIQTLFSFLLLAKSLVSIMRIIECYLLVIVFVKVFFL